MRRTTAIAGLVLLALTTAPVAQAAPPEAECASMEGTPAVPGAEKQKSACLADLTTKATVRSGHTDITDWSGLHARGTHPVEEVVPGLQIDGYFPDTSTTNATHGWRHDSQFVIRLPDEWNGKLVITGAPGVRRQYSNDVLISDFVLAKGYAFASTDKGNTGTGFYKDGAEPGDAVAEWHVRVEQLTRAAKETVEEHYGKAPGRTYMTGISNGGYLTRWAIENNPELYDGAVDWEGTLFRDGAPNIFTYLPVALRNFPAYKAGSAAAHRAMIDAGFEEGSEYQWEDHYLVYWDLTQRVYREEFDPGYDGALEGGIPFCQSGIPYCDADYDYLSRPSPVRDAVRRVSLTGDIGKPMLTLHGTHDALLPIRTDSDIYETMVDEAGRADLHRYYRFEGGSHVDSRYDSHPDKVRPLLPCYRALFAEMEDWVEKGESDPPPPSGTLPRPDDEKIDIVNECDVTPPAGAGGAGTRTGQR